MLDKPRELAEIPNDLRCTLRGLVFGKLPWPLFLHGPPGTGKTCAALALLDHVGGIYVTVPELSEKINAAQQGKLTTIGENGCAYECTVGDFWNKVRWASLAILDELGLRDRVSDAEYEKVKTFIDVREGLSLICLSNLNPNELVSTYDERIVDRITCGTVLELTGGSRRR